MLVISSSWWMVAHREITPKLGDREITEDDVKLNVQLYRDDFSAKYQRLQSSDDGAGS